MVTSERYFLHVRQGKDWLTVPGSYDTFTAAWNAMIDKQSRNGGRAMRINKYTTEVVCEKAEEADGDN